MSHQDLLARREELECFARPERAFGRERCSEERGSGLGQLGGLRCVATARAVDGIVDRRMRPCAGRGDVAVSISYAITPMAHTSHPGFTSSPATCSGAMYSSVPTSRPALLPVAVDCCERQLRVEGLGEAEVEHLRHDAARVTLEEDVLRLQVAVDETLAVGRAERRADPAQDVKRISAR